MKLYDIVSAPWAITPEMFGEVQSIYARHMRGEKIDIKSLEAKLGGPLPGPTKGYDVVNGVAVIPVDGVLAKRMNLLTAISGGTSMQTLAEDFQDALDDPLVTSIILRVDSPGGTVDGTQELTNLIYNARGQKPIVALADGTMASAAYWIASAADQIFVSSDTAMVGSIGVVSTHTDVSGSEAQRGVKTTEIAAGKYKRIASSYAPLTPEGRQSIQDQVDYTYSIFVNDVARNRGVTAETVIENMADGRVFLGQQAVDAGLVDGVATLTELIQRAADGEFSDEKDDDPLAHANGAGARQATEEVPTQQAESAGDAPQANHQEEKTMDVQKLKAEHPAVAEALINEGKALGATAERERIQGVEAQSMPGHEALIATLKFDGKTTGPEAAVQVLAAEKAKKNDRLEALRKDAQAAAVTHAAAPAPGDEDEEDDDPDAEDDSADDDASASPSGGKPKKKATIATLHDAHRVARLAQNYQAEQKANGITVSAAAAVAHIENQMKKEARRHG